MTKVMYGTVTRVTLLRARYVGNGMILVGWHFQKKQAIFKQGTQNPTGWSRLGGYFEFLTLPGNRLLEMELDGHTL
jgi:hypothetical protein